MENFGQQMLQYAKVGKQSFSSFCLLALLGMSSARQFKKNTGESTDVVLHRIRLLQGVVLPLWEKVVTFHVLLFIYLYLSFCFNS